MEAFQPGRGLVSKGMNPFQFGYRLSKQYWYLAVPALFVVILAEAAGVTLSYLLKELVDALNGEPQEIWNWAIGYVCLYAFMELCWRSSGYLGMHWITRVRSLAANSLFDWLSRHSSRYFADRFAGSLATKVTNASNGLSNMLPRMLWNFFPTFLGLIMSVGIAMLAKPLLGWILLGWAIGFLILNVLLVPKKARLSKESASAYTRLKGQMVDILSNIRVVHQFAHLRKELRHVDGCIQDQQKKILRSWSYSEGILVTNNLLQTLLLGAMLVTAIRLFQAGRISVGDVVMIVNLTWGILESLLFIGNNLNGLMEDYGEVQEGLEEILHEHEIVDTHQVKRLNAPLGEIRFKKVHFRYDQRRTIFEDFDLHIPAGQKVGLVGESGAGKSTLTQLLLRMYDVQKGAIYIDGQDISTVTQESLRQAISFVPQQSYLFHRSLHDNISYGQLEAGDEDILRVAIGAGAYRFIKDLPEGFKTMVGERGVKLSGGQAQRISIARAMLKESPILILDEATSSLDSESEHIVQEALKVLIKDKTVIAIAHRLSTLLAMDRIVVMDEGRIVEDGTHEELLGQKGIYFKLWSHQVGGFLLKA